MKAVGTIKEDSRHNYSREREAVITQEKRQP